MNASSATLWLRNGGIVLLVLGVIALVILLLANPDSYPRRKWTNYVAKVEYEVRFLFMKTTGLRVARMQLAICAVLLLVTLITLQTILLIPLLMVAMLPWMVLRSRHAARVTKMEAQLDSWLVILSNGLRATPSLGEALDASARLIREPMSDEIEVALKEIQLGTPIDQAIQNMSMRINSRVISSALATLLVGRQTGGDLSRILEQSAATLREMARLEGVVRTKTAEGKSQAMVLGAMPFVVVIALNFVDPNWLTPLFSSNMGYALMGAAFALWGSAILMARKILAVDV
ncbi:MAG: type II secretion system F family protein [Sandaracinaceae bacterium]|nr:type II secretion system F family protein [Sandaracinaceae bacterium]